MMDAEQKMLRSLWFILVGIVVLVVGVMFVAVKAFGHDHNNPERNDWLQSLHARNKTWCCNGNDHDPIDDWETKGNSYRVKFRGEWFDVPEGAIIDSPNKIGEPMLWMSKGYGGPTVRCFMPGSMT